ncbi:hypothetical protein GCM10023149_37230 [Mucilaginibacter gynuensis]|uniref:Glycosyl transferase family 1 domain-containing protein n=1 Tax=Mucilaginibacter gynuensis TaxID=1302236 RepID=A0ABP8GYH5_9SPHI
MKILHIYDHSYYEKNGLFYSSGVFGKRAWEPYFQVFDNLTILANLADSNNISVESLDISSRSGVGFSFVENKRLFKNYVKSFFTSDKKLINCIREHDGVIIRLPSELGLFAIKEAIKLKKPFAVEVVGCAWDSYWYHGSVKGKLMAYITFYRMKKALKAAPFAIYVTEYYLQKLYPTNGYSGFASNVVLPDRFDPNVLESHIQFLEKSKNKLRIGLIGTLNVEYKGHLEAILALKEIQNLVPDFELVFVGKGDSTWLEKKIAENGMTEKVIVLGKLSSGNAVFEFLDSLDLYLHPSKHEGLPRAVIEAMSRACPVLASSVAGTPELLAKDHLHTPGDYLTLSKQIHYVINNRELLKKMAKDNFEKSKIYSFSNIKQHKFEFWNKFKTTLFK